MTMFSVSQITILRFEKEISRQSDERVPQAMIQSQPMTRVNECVRTYGLELPIIIII